MNLNIQNNISFKGYETVLNQYGNKEYKFYYPFDETKYNCYLEIFKVDDKGNVKDILENVNWQQKSVKLEQGKNSFNLRSDYRLEPDEPFAYHYKLYPLENGKEDTGNPIYQLDAGKTINTGQAPEDNFNLVNTKGAATNSGGAMTLLIPDTYNNNWVLEGDNIVPNSEPKITSMDLSTKSGGSLAGILNGLETGEFDSYTNIVSTPLVGDDSLTHHGYWTKNPMQMIQSLGSIDDYAALQKKMFAKGISLVSDAAIVNEGLQGIHFRRVLKYQNKIPEYYWFRIYNLPDNPLKMGILGKNSESVKNRIVQSHGKTFIQIYDERKISKLPPDNELIEAYDKSIDNPLDINDHNDTVMLYACEIEPKILKQNFKNLEELNRIRKRKGESPIAKDSFDAARILMKTDTWEADGKFESGFETWDANPDIAKLKYFFSSTDTAFLSSVSPYDVKEIREKMLRGCCEVQDLAITYGQYWTRKTNQILNLYAARALINIDEGDAENAYKQIMSCIEGKGKPDSETGEFTKFPDKLKNNISEDIVGRVLGGTYVMKELPDGKYRDSVLRGLMDVPLDSIEIGDEISGVFSSPFISKRAAVEKDLGKSRYEVFKEGNPNLPAEYKNIYKKADSLYTEEMYGFAREILEKVDSKLALEQKLKCETSKEDGSGTKTEFPTEFGKYVIPLLTAEIVKFAVIKGLRLDAVLNRKSFENRRTGEGEHTGEVSYNYKELKQTTLKDLDIDKMPPEDEAEELIEKLKNGINKISPEEKDVFAQDLFKLIEGTNEHSFRLAEVIVDRSGAGLAWRIDAAKDIADIEAMKGGLDSKKDTIKNITSFWNKFIQAVLKENRNAYTAAEITDIDIPEFLPETGITTMADYTYFFHNITKIFGKDFEKGEQYDNAANIIPGQIRGMSNPLESILYSYTFVGNHDKPRALHCLAMDMGLFYADLTNTGERGSTPETGYVSQADAQRYRETAYKLIKGQVFGNIDQNDFSNFPFSKFSSKAIAMGQSLLSGFGKFLEQHKNEFGQDRKDEIFKALVKSISELVQGRYCGEEFDAVAFGVKPFDVTINLVLNQMKHEGLELSGEEHRKLEDGVFETILKPAVQRFKAIMKFLVALPGNPTLYAGDDLGMTGYEFKTKNITAQNRNPLPHGWAESKKFIGELQKDIKQIMGLRKRPELCALNDGAPFVLSQQNTNEGYEAGAVLRQSANGAMAVSVFNTADIDHRFDQEYTPKHLTLKQIDLSALRGGLRDGVRFFNADTRDANTYIVQDGSIRKENGSDIDIYDSTLILYHKPDNSNVSFTGRRVLYNPQYSFVSNPYECKKPHITGAKLIHSV